MYEVEVKLVFTGGINWVIYGVKCKFRQNQFSLTNIYLAYTIYPKKVNNAYEDIDSAIHESIK